jgi:glycosyltransferase involved in cell wall biosynthesis
MRVLHLGTTGFSGGAGKGLLGLHRGLVDLGIESIVLAALGPSPRQPDHHTAGGFTRLVVRLDTVLLRIFGGGSDVTFSTNLLPTPVPRIVRRLRPDVVHFHWVGSGLLSAKQLSEIAAAVPSVWTLRDMLPFTGGCHYAGTCKRYERVCGSCPALRRSGPHDLSSYTHGSKRRAVLPDSLRIVALSQWLAERARRSSLLLNRPITVIPPGVDASVFHPNGRNEARQSFGITHATPVLGFVALHPYQEARKGFSLLDEALGRVELLHPGLVSLITAAPPTASRSTCWRSVGTFGKEEDLRRLYQACDVVVVPSTEEAFGKVTLEALACGTPVVLFADTGGVDVVNHLQNGFVATRRHASDLAPASIGCSAAGKRACW